MVEGIGPLLALAIIVVGILQIMLFFKIWGMTNNISQMVEHTAELLPNVKNLQKNVVIICKAVENQGSEETETQVNMKADADLETT